MHTREENFMHAAIQLSRSGMNDGSGGPFGCIVVKGEEVIGRGCNSVTSKNDPTAHAEIVAIRDACQVLNTFQLTGCEIYSSCEPCPMCMGAIYWARPERVYFANSRKDAAAAGFDDSFIYDELIVPLESRKIAMIRVSSDEAHQVFKEWLQIENKIQY